jgi:4-methyl-5(b-hydroxyethyl)-thiazole monophosphate biosynthesis
MREQIVLILAEGFEEVEAVGTIDVLRRSGIELTIAGLEGLVITGAHDIVIQADCELSEISADKIKMVILPGGLPGATNLRDSSDVIALVKNVYDSGNYIAAICAAPIVLAKAGLIDGKTVTCYPGFESQLTKATCTGNLCEVDGRIITGKGPGAVFAFSKCIVETLGKSEEAKKTLAGMFVS